MLRFHEQLYVLAQSVGHSDSNAVRYFTTKFFAQSNEDLVGQPGLILISNSTYEVKNGLVYQLGDYVQYFTRYFKPVEGQPFHSSHHFKTFLDLDTRMRTKMIDCIKEVQRPDLCLHEIMDPHVLAPVLSPEEAFIYLAAFLLERPKRLINYDIIMDPDERDPTTFSQGMKVACAFIESYQGYIANYMTPMMGDKALDYCAEWKKGYSIQGNKSN
jgi:hypothetical protein